MALKSMTNHTMNIDDQNRQVIENIRSLIEETGTNVSRLAKEAGLGHTSIRDILAKPGASPKYDTLLKIAKAAGVDIRRLTIGPDFNALEDRQAEFDGIFHELEPQEQDFLINAAKAQLAARHSSPKPPDAEDQ